MKVLSSLIGFILLFHLVGCSSNETLKNPEDNILADLISNTNKFDSCYTSFSDQIKNKRSQEFLISEIKNLRNSYKTIESFVSYYYPYIQRVLNAPAIDEYEIIDRKVTRASGLQLLEEIICEDSLDYKKLLAAHDRSISAVKHISYSVKNGLYLNPETIFLTQKLALLRLVSLGITGYDSPAALNSIEEAKATLNSLRNIISHYPHSELFEEKIVEAIGYILKNDDFDSFDRYQFITKYIEAINGELLLIEKKLNIVPKKNGMLAWDKNISFSDKLLFNTYFSLNISSEFDNYNNLNELGKQLFHDPNLSNTGIVSCATCHNEKLAYSDGRKTATGHGGKKMNRNTPTLLYSGFQTNFFLDGRAFSLTKQIFDVLSDSDEMFGDFSSLVRQLNQKPEYKKLFKKYFPKEDSITHKQILFSIGAFVDGLSPFNSKFDKAFFEKEGALKGDELEGFNLFMGKAKCATCHFFPLFNGLLPPFYKSNDLEIIGTPSSVKWESASISKDVGAYNTFKNELHRNAFKTPTIRNVEKTAPYMHNGVYGSLEEVIRFYNMGGGHGIGIDLKNQTLPIDSLNLTEKEQRALISFLKALSDQEY